VVIARDARADGAFYYSVRTTGVYCRPSCAARLPRPENVRFHATCKDAERAGFRPCKRCTPDRPSPLVQRVAKITTACRILENAEPTPALQELARRVGVSGYHFHRVFKQLTGLTPRQYAAAHRAKRLRQELAGGRPITQAIFNAGYSSSGHFYAHSNELLGMTPRHYRAGGAHTQIRFGVGSCSLGAVLVACSDRGVCAILLGEDADELAQDLRNRFPNADLVRGNAAFDRLVATVVSLVEAPGTSVMLPLDVRGTAFQQRVWQALCKIPVGTTASYSEIAKRIGAPNAVRAVARACAANPLAVAIPCHRAVRSDGSLAGYRWGVERKRALLARENHSGDCRSMKLSGKR
jgi:AraC family transcriptional regulator of adaptative response/methylated-DNA-[protein]-cysteine methyltransferase